MDGEGTKKLDGKESKRRRKDIEQDKGKGGKKEERERRETRRMNKMGKGMKDKKEQRETKRKGMGEVK